MQMLRLGKRKCGTLVVLFSFSVLLIVFGAVLSVIIDLIIQAKLREYLPLSNGTFVYNLWQEPPATINFQIYVFDIVNPKEIADGSGVPAVVEKGPYVYRVSIVKKDIRWHDNNNTIEYVQPQTFVFDREASVGPESDRFLTVNIPYITVATLLRFQYQSIQDAVDALFRFYGETAFMNRSVAEIWWGYEEPVLQEVAKLLHSFNITIPILNGKFGVFVDKNNSGDGLYNIFSGVNDNFDNYVQIDRWNGKRNLSVWMSDYANEIRGSDGSMQTPYVTENSNLSVFDAYLYRSFKLQYSAPSSYADIKTLRFHIPYSEFASGEENPANQGFCTPNCIPSGAYNLSVAYYYAPMYGSLPHFVGGDPYYQKQVLGLNPSQEKHQPFYDIQPISGVSMAVARRYQINIRTQSFPYFTEFKNFPVSYLPFVWIDGAAYIHNDTASMLKGMIQDSLDAMPYVHWSLFGVGGAMFIISISLFIYWKKKSGKPPYSYMKVAVDEDACINDNRRPNYNSISSGPLSTPPDGSLNQDPALKDEVIDSANSASLTNSDNDKINAETLVTVWK